MQTIDLDQYTLTQVAGSINKVEISWQTDDTVECVVVHQDEINSALCKVVRDHSIKKAA